MAPIIYPRPLPLTRLPENEKLSPPPPGNDAVERPPLQDFLQDVLREGHKLIRDGPLNNTHRKKKRGKSPELDLYHAKLGLDHQPVAPGRSTSSTGILWVGARSVHEPGTATDSATYCELRQWLKEEHVTSHKEYMKDVSASRTLFNWECAGVTGLEKFTDISASGKCGKAP
jgi:hypothetical protein